MNRLIMEYDRDHPGVRKALVKCLAADLRLYTKIGFPKCLGNTANIIVIKMVKIIVEGKEKAPNKN